MDDELNNRLKPLRERIDALDAQLIALLNQRAAVALEVGEVKKHFNAPVFRPEREQQVIARLQDMSEGPLASEHISAIWREIMAASRALEKTIKAAYLGPVGTYSEQAMHEYFGQSIEGLPCPSIDEVFRSVEAGAAEFGVVPVENSTEGAVSRTLDLLLQTQLAIGGELALPIHHNLLTLNGGLAGVTRVCAHAQALAQCQRWLATNARHLERQAVSSNAEAARGGGRSDRRGDRGRPRCDPLRLASCLCANSGRPAQPHPLRHDRQGAHRRERTRPDVADRVGGK
jgi:chorismate mutase/prephenate dehydratase